MTFNRDNFDRNHFYAILGLVDLDKARVTFRKYHCELPLKSSVETLQVMTLYNKVCLRNK